MSIPFMLSDSSLLHQQSYVDAQWVKAKSGDEFDIVDPGTGQPWASCPDNGPGDVDAAIQSSHRAFQVYRKLTPRKRAQLLLAWHNLITAARDDLAAILTHETGKPLAEAYGELDYSLGFTWWFAGEAERIQGAISTPSAPNRRVLVVKQPLGVAVALVPWNFPVAMILRKAGAAFAAGCTIVVKPSPETPLTCLALADLATRAGFAPGVFNVLTTSLRNTPSLSEALCLHPLVQKVTFTGSTRVGKIVAGLCARNLKKCTLELGGNCPFIVFDDANLDQALEQFLALKWRHAGQACVTANRLYVQSGVHDRFVSMLVEKTKKLVVGHGANEDTTMGPLTTLLGVEKAEAQVSDALAQGAVLALGTGKGTVAGQDGGYFMAPTILTGMKHDMLMSREETFAPVCGLFKFDTEAEVVKWANDTSMGLASYAFTKNVDRVWRMAENLEAGMIGLNTGNSSAAESPFGGMKESGYGKESGKDVAVNEYLVAKTITITIDDEYGRGREPGTDLEETPYHHRVRVILLWLLQQRIPHTKDKITTNTTDGLTKSSAHYVKLWQEKVVLERGENHLVTDVDGRQYIDLISQIAVMNFGNSHPRIIKAVVDQVQKMPLVNTAFINPLYAQFADRITKKFGFDSIATILSGSKAIEPSSPADFGKHLPHVGPFGPSTGKLIEFGDIELDGHRIAAFIVETVQGLAGDTYRKFKIFVKPQHLAEDLKPDLVALGKAGTGGFVPVSVLMGRSHVMDLISKYEIAGTFSASPIACAVALATLDVMEEEKISERAQRLGELCTNTSDEFKPPYILDHRRRGHGQSKLLSSASRSPEAAKEPQIIDEVISADSLLSNPTTPLLQLQLSSLSTFESPYQPSFIQSSNMKLIVAGATGFVATEVIRQSLLMREVTSVIALSRKPISLDSSAGSSKLKTVIVKDYDFYPEDVRKEFADANACIWTVAITPSKSKSFEFAEVKRVCQDAPLAGLKAMHEASPSRPFRFVYMSGFTAERDQTKTPDFMPQYTLMRGETETKLLAYAAEHQGQIEVCAAKSGFITAPGIALAWRTAFAFVLKLTHNLASVGITEISAAMLNQVVHGFEKEPLFTEDLVRIGREALKKQETESSG
ncbi:Succinate-semialdehyde dehydrogenase [NADP(+)] [Neonectria ditissima]|uniref:Succinate-semialdehyde dehydrogenase [NADP(+)] n=1 Tax=Neonectria ditissima TaxID=78410 RepID=A0A0P7AFK5_9HYPO|nr:Succinate-semialdehyde dehydrogenase [NADP(+)] [Neonectria ditissima]